MLLPSSLPAQAASAIGSNNIIAARLADIPNATRLQRFDAPAAVRALSQLKRNPHLALAPAPMFRHRPGAIGEAMAHGPGLISARDSAGQWDEAAPRGSVSAALGGRCRVLDRDLRELMLLERDDPLVGMVMARMLVVMATHLGIGVQHAVLDQRGLDRRCMRRPAGRHRGRGENGNGKQRCGNCLEHDSFLFRRDHEMAGRMAGFVDRWCDLRGGELNPC